MLSLAEFRFKFLWFDSHQVISILEVIGLGVRLRALLLTA
jgi:hypothetical protein